MPKTTINFSSDEETFFDVITLGLTRKLKNLDGLTSLNIEKRLPCSRLTVANWEQNNGVSLPADLKEFYASTDGFEMSWKYQPFNSREMKEDENIIVGGEIKISSLTNVRPLNFVHKQKIKNQNVISRPKMNYKTSKAILNIHENTWNQNNFKMAFVFSHHDNVGTICLVYLGSDKEQNHPATVSSPKHAAAHSSIWLLDMANNWHFLAKNFSSYFRMMLVHVGLQDWQLKFTSQGLTKSCRRTTSSVLPRLLHEDNNINDTSIKLEITANIINSNIFKLSQANSKSSKSTPTNSKHSSYHKAKKN